MNVFWLTMMAASIVVGILSGRSGAVLSAMLYGSGRGIALALELAAAYGLWTGFLEVARGAGMLKGLSRLIAPLIRRLLPGVEAGSLAGEAVAANVAANMLGMGNAATPAGIAAMKEMSAAMKDGAATDAMCAFMVLNCVSIQLYPAAVVAVRTAAGAAHPADIVIPGLLAAACSAAAGILAVMAARRMGGRSP